MSRNSKILIDIYKKAKADRIVLNQTEFAKALDYSRVHLFDKKIKKEDDISDALIERAKSLIKNNTTNNTKYVSRETDDNIHPSENNTISELLALLKMEKDAFREALKKEQDNLGKAQDAINSQQYIIRRYIEKEPDVGDETKNPSASPNLKTVKSQK